MIRLGATLRFVWACWWGQTHTTAALVPRVHGPSVSRWVQKQPFRHRSLVAQWGRERRWDLLEAWVEHQLLPHWSAETQEAQHRLTADLTEALFVQAKWCETHPDSDPRLVHAHGLVRRWERLGLVSLDLREHPDNLNLQNTFLDRLHLLHYPVAALDRHVAVQRSEELADTLDQVLEETLVMQASQTAAPRRARL